MTNSRKKFFSECTGYPKNKLERCFLRPVFSGVLNFLTQKAVKYKVFIIVKGFRYVPHFVV